MDAELYKIAELSAHGVFFGSIGLASGGRIFQEFADEKEKLCEW